MWYLFGLTMLVCFSLGAASLGSAARSPLLVAGEWLAWAALNAAGVWLCYDVNRRGDDREFLNRFVCLSWPISIRTLTVLVPVSLVAGLAATWVAYRRGSDGTPEAEFVELGLGAVSQVAFYWQLRSYVRLAAAR